MKHLKPVSLSLLSLSMVAMAACTASPASDTTKEDGSKDVAAAKTPAATIVTQSTTPQYDVVKRTEAAVIDGSADDEVWSTVQDISGTFHYPWEDKEAPVTVFKAYNDGTNLYFLFDVTDPDVLVDEEWKDDESTVDNEDRAELFFAGGPVDKPGADGMPLYYGVEVDPDGRVHDYSLEYYRKFDGTWNLEGMETAGQTTDGGYVVEGMIPLKSLEDLGLINDDNVMRTGVYRAEFSKNPDGDEPIMEWISWVNPKTEAPDYHVDSSFGEFRILEN